MRMKIENKLPLITIALPVFNEERYIQQTLQSLIDQDYPNLRILIADNCSTDRTSDICKALANQDKRIEYYRHDRNIGVAKNHIFLTKKVDSKYFMFAAGHDYWSNTLISRCIFFLENVENATVAYGTPVWVDEENNVLPGSQGWYDTRGLNPLARFFMVFWGGMNPILGVMRWEAIPDLEKYTFTGADLIVLAELALKGYFVHVTDVSFYRRRNRGAENYMKKLKRYKSADMQINSSSFSKIFPLARLPFELLRVVLRSRLSFLQKMLVVMMLVPALPVRYMIGKQDQHSQ